MKNNKIYANKLLAKLYLGLKGSNVFPIEKVYYPRIIADVRYLFGGVLFMDFNNNDCFFLTTRDFGVDTLESVAQAKSEGYKHVSDSTFKNKLDIIEKPYVRIKEADEWW